MHSVSAARTCPARSSASAFLYSDSAVEISGVSVIINPAAQGWRDERWLHFGASRIAPSRRITSPLSISLVTIWCTSLA